MKIQQVNDCIKTSPPSTAFVFYPETEADLAYLAEVSDLPTANRLLPETLPGLRDVEFAEVKRRSTTIRMLMTGLTEHMEMPGADADYWGYLLKQCAGFGVSETDLLKKAFIIRCCHY